MVALVAAGCGSSSSDAGPRPATTTRPATSIARSTTTVDQEAADKAEITDTFNGWVELEKQFEMEKLKWTDALATKYLDGPFLSFSRSWITKWQAQGKKTRPPLHSMWKSSLDILELDERDAVGYSCIVDDLIAETKGGATLDDRLVTHFAHMKFRMVDGIWKIWDVIDQRTVNGEKSCGR
jgi:hypothetical protein